MIRILGILTFGLALGAFARVPERDCNAVMDLQVQRGLSDEPKYLTQVADYLEEHWDLAETALKATVGSTTVEFGRAVARHLDLGSKYSPSAILKSLFDGKKGGNKSVVFYGCTQKMKIGDREVIVPTDGSYFSMDPDVTQGAKMKAEPIAPGDKVTIVNDTGEIDLTFIKIGNKLKAIPVKTATERCEYCAQCAAGAAEKNRGTSHQSGPVRGSKSPTHGVRSAKQERPLAN
ncbi:MAG: hypothetical protein H6617_12000 [Bdellovibrionaceae bacterium]|nr:hypothetical protein [Bdellovibrionales bacterium]MCB9255396.1 hypothetical protein [Pseudobdellovibrionaceae bacterium]